MYGSESIFPASYKTEENDQGEEAVFPEEETLADRMARETSGIPYLFMIAIVVATIILNFTISKILMKIRNHWVKKVPEAEQSVDLSDHIETIKKRGVSSYKMSANPNYRPLIEAINNAAAQQDVEALAAKEKEKIEAKKKKKSALPPTPETIEKAAESPADTSKGPEDAPENLNDDDLEEHSIPEIGHSLDRLKNDISDEHSVDS
jgi:hypothetical protein